MKALIIAATAALIAGPALALDANHFESPAEAAAYGQTFNGSADLMALYNDVTSPAEKRALNTVDANAVVSTKSFSKVIVNGLDSPAEQAALR